MKNPIQSRRNKEALKRAFESYIGKKNFNLWAILYVILLVISFSWLPDGLSELLYLFIPREWWAVVLKISISLLVLFLIYLQLKKAIKDKIPIEVVVDQPSAVRHLAIFLSFLRQDDLLTLEQAINGNKSPEEIEKILADKPWKMPLCAIKHHLSMLKNLYVFTSKETTSQFEIFKKVINILYPDIVVEEYKSGGIEFQDIKKVFEAVDGFYTDLKEKGIKDEDIIVDITGGQVTNSVAAAVATLAEGRKFQYVSTRDKKVLRYDIEYFEKEKSR